MGTQPRPDLAGSAAALGVEPEIVSFVAELMAGVWALGSFPELVVEALQTTDLPSRAQVLELGCGKGAVAIAIARDIGCAVRGIDRFAPFVEEAAARARALGVARRCRFEVGDFRDMLPDLGGHDAVVLAAVGAGVFGDYSSCVEALRGTVRVGGWVVINDGFARRHDRDPLPGYEYYRAHDETLSQLTAHGDRVVREIRVPPGELAACNRTTCAIIRANAERLAAGHPEHAERLLRFAEVEERECRFIEEATEEAVWLLRRC